MGTLIASIIFTIVVLVLSLLTITKGYGYKHSVDPISDNRENESKEQMQKKD